MGALPDDILAAFDALDEVEEEEVEEVEELDPEEQVKRRGGEEFRFRRGTLIATKRFHGRKADRLAAAQEFARQNEWIIV